MAPLSPTTPSLRIAQFIEVLDAGGAEALAIDIAAELATRGHESYVIVLRGKGPFELRVPANVHLVDLDRPRRDGSQIGRIVYFARTAGRLGRVLQSLRIDVMQTHLPKANFLGLYAGWRGICRVFPTVHNNREFDYGDASGPARMAFRRELYRRMLSSCNGMIAVSAAVKESLVGELGVPGRLADRISVVPNGVRNPERPTGPERARLRAQWGVGEDEVLVASLGRLTRQKNFAMLLAALATMRDGEAGWRCVIAGDGELREDLERLVDEAGLRDKVALPGLIADPGALLGAADVFCLPSLYEGLPLALLEAMSAGLPVAATAIDGVTDLVKHGEQGLLSPAGDVEGLAASIRALVGNHDLRTTLGGHARQVVQEQFDFRRSVDRLVDLYGGQGSSLGRAGDTRGKD